MSESNKCDQSNPIPARGYFTPTEWAAMRGEKHKASLRLLSVEQVGSLASALKKAGRARSMLDEAGTTICATDMALDKIAVSAGAKSSFASPEDAS